MREFQERRRIKKFLHSRYAIAVLLIILVVMSRAVWGVYQKHQKSEEIVARAQSDLKVLKEREAMLGASIKALETEEGKEREIRDRFGVVREGERLIVLVDDSVKAKQEVVSDPKSWWERFLEKIGL